MLHRESVIQIFRTTETSWRAGAPERYELAGFSFSVDTAMEIGVTSETRRLVNLLNNSSSLGGGGVARAQPRCE